VDMVWTDFNEGVTHTPEWQGSGSAATSRLVV